VSAAALAPEPGGAAVADARRRLPTRGDLHACVVRCRDRRCSTREIGCDAVRRRREATRSALFSCIGWQRQ